MGMLTAASHYSIPTIEVISNPVLSDRRSGFMDKDADKDLL
jgi:hypothetical protein